MILEKNHLQNVKRVTGIFMILENILETKKELWTNVMILEFLRKSALLKPRVSKCF